MSEAAQSRFQINCLDCPVTEAGDDVDTVVAVADTHEAHTGHTVEWVRADFKYDVTLRTDRPIDIPELPADLGASATAVKRLVRTLEDQYEAGVPRAVILGVVSEQRDAPAVAHTIQALRRLQQQGALDEPAPDVLRTT